MKIIFKLIPISMIFLICLPLIFTGCKASEFIVIDAPIEKVWNYASDSTQAKNWSIYFDHITPLPGRTGITDGQVGSTRRCYRRADETGMSWDEDVVELRPLEYRQIRTYHIQGYKEAKLNTFEYKVEQIYEKWNDHQTKLTFQASVAKGFDLEALYYLLRDYRAGSRILKLNLENIKSQIEGRPRPHPFEPDSRWD